MANEIERIEDIANDICKNIVSLVKANRGNTVDITLEEVKKHLLSRIRETLTSAPADFFNLKQLLIKKLNQQLEVIPEVIPLGGTIQHIFSKVRFWLEDELILVFPKNPDYIQEFKEKLSRVDNPVLFLQEIGIATTDGSRLYFDIEFKSEFIKKSKQYDQNDYTASPSDPISLVVQCMFIVCYKNGVLYTLHDRSYSGAEDRLSKYALITGRLSVIDLLNGVAGGKISVNRLCKNTLIRELQEIDELGLPKESAKRYVEESYVTEDTPDAGQNTRIKFIGVYEDKKGRVLSLLYAIFATFDEYNNDLTKRGPYLIPINPKEFSKLRILNLLNDILDHNSCSSCRFDENIVATLQQRDCENCERKSTCVHQEKPCIIWDISEEICRNMSLEHFKENDLLVNREKNIGKYRTRLTSNTAIIALDISDYSLLSTKTTLEIRDQLRRLIRSFLPMHHTHASDDSYRIHTTPNGYTIILRKQSNSQLKEMKIALVAYFFSIYLGMKLSHLKEWQKNKQPDIRIGLHTDDLETSTSFSGEEYSPGNGINKAFRIVNFGQRRQILCSQNFAVQLLAEIEECGTQVEAYQADKINNLRKRGQAGIWDSSKLPTFLSSLGIPPVVAMEICKDKSIIECFQRRGLPICDFGFFTEDNGPRHRVFNLGIFNSENEQPVPSGQTRDTKLLTEQLFDYGNVEQPIARVPIIYRNKNTTNDELRKLVDSLQYAQRLTIYGYSNIRMMKEIYKKYIVGESKLRYLVDLNVIFYDYNQYKDINETKPLTVTQVHWIRGFLYAHKIAQQLRDIEINVKITINKMRYGFNVFKVAYAIESPTEYRDHIRFTVPMPGRAFELSPVFIINRGDSLYHGFLEICEKYIEQGIKENSDDISIEEYEPADKGGKWIEELFGASPTEINGVSNNQYLGLTEGKENNRQEILEKLGEYSNELIKERDFTEAYRLWKCFDYLKNFDHQRFLKEF